MSGAEIGREANVASGALYPLLMRFERSGLLTSRWESGDPSVMGRPRRRFYRVTGLGRARARATAAELAPLLKLAPA